MSRSQNGRNNDQPSDLGGSVRRAREQAETIIRGGYSEPLSARRHNLQIRDEQGQIGMAISKPTPVAQWPLPGPISAPAMTDAEPYRPPPGRSQPPQRPPRPSRTLSILDSSRVQDHTPVFQYTPQDIRTSELSAPETIPSTSSRRSNTSSVGSIPDFPLPVTTPPPQQPRRSVTLGPPPSSRRGASSFYSTASFVSPIPEESPRTRSHASYASSAAIPESFGSLTPGYSPNSLYVDDTIAEESIASDDESRLVRNASIGKRGKPSLVTTSGPEKKDGFLRPGPSPVPGGPFRDGTGYLEASSSSSGNGSREAVGAAVTPESMLNAFEGASATDPSSLRKATPSPRPYRFSAIRRPPRLDIDAVRKAEQRGSLTSLPDLIRRATRLAALMDRGRRPASRFDELDFPEEVYNNESEKEYSYDMRHQSGLSGMLAAFPPPGSRNDARKSRASTSWPLTRMSFRGPPAESDRSLEPETESQKKKRRCCGLPICTFFVLALILLCIITAAVVVPVKFLVIDKAAQSNRAAQETANECETQLVCANGGTNVQLNGTCSCICSNGFTGVDCTIPTSQGCTTTSISMATTSISNVTIGQAIPRLIRDAQANFSIPLVATEIQSKFNKENLSCVIENALVTFDGQFLQAQKALSEVSNLDTDQDLVKAGVVGNEVPITLSVLPDVDITVTVQNPAGTGAFSGSFVVTTLTSPTTISGSTIFATTITDSNSKRATPTPMPTTAPASTSTTRSRTTSATTTAATATPSASFDVSTEIVDFARVAVLYIFQEQTLDDASNAQTSIQNFFRDVGSGQNTTSAMNVTLGGGNTIDFVDLSVDIGDGQKVGGRGG